MAQTVSPPRPGTSPSSGAGRGRLSGARTALPNLSNRLFDPVDIASLVAFRILFGAIMLWEVYRYFSNGWIEEYFIRPTFHFTYYGFGWVTPWPGDGMFVHFAVLGVLAIYIMVGFYYRIAAALFFVGFTYVFLLEGARYLNHFYFVTLISFLMILVPAHRAFSVDALWRPGLRSQTAPTWALWILRAQVAVVFFYAGVAKLNGDWLHAQPLGMWLADSTDFPVIGHFLNEQWAAYVFSYSGLLIDLLVVPLLCWPRTRPYAFLAAAAFHLTNAQLFQIGIFPWLSLAAALIFFPPDWPRLRRLRGRLRRSPLPPADSRVPKSSPPLAGQPVARLRPAQRVTVALLAAYLAVQVLVPLRHLFYPGNVSWTEEGHQFAWHMKLRDKSAEAAFIATDRQTGRRWTIDPERYLTEWQYEKMATRPDMALQFAHHVADDLRRRGVRRVELRPDIEASLNGRRPQRLVDPAVNLAAEKRTVFGYHWIEPLREPLP